MVFASIREHVEHCDFFGSTSRDKKFALRVASSLESTTREQRALLIFLACRNTCDGLSLTSLIGGNVFPLIKKYQRDLI